MKILVFGAGAIGGVLGALLSRRNDVLLVARGEHLAAMQSNGLRIEGAIKEIFEVKASDGVPPDEKFDLILITVKAYSTEEAAKSCSGHLSDGGAVLTVQNGLGNAEKLAEVFGPENVASGVTSMAAHRLAPGSIEYVAAGEVTLGNMDGKRKAVDIAEEALKGAGVGTRRTDNIVGALWSKAIVNAAINTLTAVFACRNGLVADNVVLRTQAIKVCDEGERVAKALGIKLEPENVRDYTLEVARKTAQNKSSMLMDIETKRRTEIDAICGKIIDAGKSKGVETPAISRLYSIVAFMESRDSLLRKLNMQT